MTVILDASQMQTRREAHRYLKQELGLPEYYGENLDALYDVLTTLADVQVAFENRPQEPTYFQKALRVFQAAATKNPGLVLL